MGSDLGHGYLYLKLDFKEDTGRYQRRRRDPVTINIEITCEYLQGARGEKHQVPSYANGLLFLLSRIILAGSGQGGGIELYIHVRI